MMSEITGKTKENQYEKTFSIIKENKSYSIMHNKQTRETEIAVFEGDNDEPSENVIIPHEIFQCFLCFIKNFLS